MDIVVGLHRMVWVLPQAAGRDMIVSELAAVQFRTLQKFTALDIVFHLLGYRGIWAQKLYFHVLLDFFE
jgi:hypothetical protein